MTLISSAEYLAPKIALYGKYRETLITSLADDLVQRWPEFYIAAHTKYRKFYLDDDMDLEKKDDLKNKGLSPLEAEAIFVFEDTEFWLAHSMSSYQGKEEILSYPVRAGNEETPASNVYSSPLALGFADLYHADFDPDKQPMMFTLPNKTAFDLFDHARIEAGEQPLYGTEPRLSSQDRMGQEKMDISGSGFSRFGIVPLNLYEKIAWAKPKAPECDIPNIDSVDLVSLLLERDAKNVKNALYILGKKTVTDTDKALFDNVLPLDIMDFANTVAAHVYREVMIAKFPEDAGYFL